MLALPQANIRHIRKITEYTTRWWIKGGKNVQLSTQVWPNGSKTPGETGNGASSHFRSSGTQQKTDHHYICCWESCRPDEPRPDWWQIDVTCFTLWCAQVLSSLFYMRLAEKVVFRSAHSKNTFVIVLRSEAVWYALDRFIHLRSIKIKASAHLSTHAEVMDTIWKRVSALARLLWTEAIFWSHHVKGL